MKILTVLLITGLFPIMISAQVAPDKYRVNFTDKNNSPYSIEHPEDFLTQKAIDRRIRQGIPVVENDLPVNPSYVNAVKNTGATLLNVSRWFNMVTVMTDDTAVLNAIDALPFVLSVDKLTHKNPKKVKNSVKPFFENETLENISGNDLYKGDSKGRSYDYGQGWNQINMVNGIALHDKGFDGAGMTIAVLDAGFLNADVLAAFDSLWMNNRILGWKDFADPLSPDIFGAHSHGSMVLSTMGAYLPGQLVGTAPQASYWLLRSEDAATEYLIEELNWVSAAEFADSVGADVINSSLAYTTFDDPSQNHTYADLDGNTAPGTIGADLAASKGILVVNSAGNWGGSPWQYIGVPADGDSVFTIGAVNSSGAYVSFSSTGPTADGRIKPDVVAQGRSSAVINPYNGSVASGSGTSFSSPITAGMVACLWQAHQEHTNAEIMEAVRQSASQYNNPDTLLGYGIPDYLKADSMLSVPVTTEITLNIKVFLQGPYGNNTMSAGLLNVLPEEQPYDVAPFNYFGNEQVSSIPGNDITDWILVELRNATTPSQAGPATVIARRAAFLKQNGLVVDTSGTNMLTFEVPDNANVFVVIYHRNHLSVMSSEAMGVAGKEVVAWDFTTGFDKVYGGAAGYKALPGGAFGMAAGDGNADGSINKPDEMFMWEESAGEQGYFAGDYNCNTQTDNVDKDNLWYYNSGLTSQVPQ